MLRSPERTTSWSSPIKKRVINLRREPREPPSLSVFERAARPLRESQAYRAAEYLLMRTNPYLQGR
jgi:hypothetical protein